MPCTVRAFPPRKEGSEKAGKREAPTSEDAAAIRCRRGGAKGSNNPAIPSRTGRSAFQSDAPSRLSAEGYRSVFRHPASPRTHPGRSSPGLPQRKSEKRQARGLFSVPVENPAAPRVALDAESDAGRTLRRRCAAPRQSANACAPPARAIGGAAAHLARVHALKPNAQSLTGGHITPQEPRRPHEVCQYPSERPPAFMGAALRRGSFWAA